MAQLYISKCFQLFKLSWNNCKSLLAALLPLTASSKNPISQLSLFGDPFNYLIKLERPIIKLRSFRLAGSRTGAAEMTPPSLINTPDFSPIGCRPSFMTVVKRAPEYLKQSGFQCSMVLPQAKLNVFNTCLKIAKNA